MYGFSLEKQSGYSIMAYRRYNTRPSGLVVVDNLGSTAVVTSTSHADSGVHIPDLMETVLFGRETSQTDPAIADPTNDTLHDDLKDLSAAARIKWQSALDGENPLTVRTFLAERKHEMPDTTDPSVEFVGYIASPSEIAAIEGIASYLQGQPPNRAEEPGTGLYL